MTDGTMIDRQAAVDAITDVTKAFLDAIDEVIADPELAVKVKQTAEANILLSILQQFVPDFDNSL